MDYSLWDLVAQCASEHMEQDCAMLAPARSRCLQKPARCHRTSLSRGDPAAAPGECETAKHSRASRKDATRSQHPRLATARFRAQLRIHPVGRLRTGRSRTSSDNRIGCNPILVPSRNHYIEFLPNWCPNAIYGYLQEKASMKQRCRDFRSESCWWRSGDPRGCWLRKYLHIPFDIGGHSCKSTSS